MQAEECNEDGGDCSNFIHDYPDCNVDEPELIGDGHCDGMPYFTEDCGMDGSDCELCNIARPAWIGNGICNGGAYLSEDCSYDGGDCNQCLEETGVNPIHLGDGYCDQELNTTTCGWDGFDCLDTSDPRTQCQVEDKTKLGDGNCDGGVYNSEECQWDQGDCLKCNAIVPDETKIGKIICEKDDMGVVGDFQMLVQELT